VKRWFDRYDGTVASLQQKHRSGRPPILNKQQVNKLITKVVRSHNRLSSTIDYIKIANFIGQETNINISFRTIRRYGQNSGIRYKKTIKRTYTESEYKASSHRLLVICCLF
jgi:transposase